ncbi:fumarylacetoacetate hydrolase family protein [Yoonia sediminilitoris]|uniref:2-keto-4-pentenoate hydratase/2-oxohepta-3-ene-1,7-dioic acid hydratase in catechol pathway n=1 Tax=Yoonia sediminilitoris TaxID=1286148 RepID=A0A2T6KG97_9RHOB|nr:fumarylacetoacetate hydrolase family protein [Yoonia sediminilitoris]PUB14343.1 2-keto-4-pentenoate hydratase/2-oxohepta-3-ene-1,7-dioic acid hydratase in catechol pathway [Yoonia sediminilitoris]RCW95274.1 2-keto-4-pentenoate hydratase/2-oxohepta-3-ene-1,7-dioic acid hydratase in catechol pathway [Yoonia sediminilitoris]
MRFLVGTSSDGTAVYSMDGDKAVNLSALDARVGSDLMGLINTDGLLDEVAAKAASAPRAAINDITPALPIENPGKIICLGLNYVDHIKEGGYDIPEYPALFMRGRQSLMAAGAPMVRPTVSEKLDYEVELMVIVGKGGRHISEESALDHVFAYTVFNDGSVRDFQRKTHQWTPGKNFDDTGAIGPISVTPDELPEGAVDLKIESRVGDEILQSASTSDMMWSVAKTIALVSQYTTLVSGDYLAMGTPPGVGHAKTPPRWLRPGETVECEIEGIGICASPILDEINLTRREAL